MSFRTTVRKLLHQANRRNKFSLSHFVRSDIFLLIGFILLTLNTYAQPYENHTYQPSIKTIQLYNKNKEQSFPVIALGSSEQLLLSFDDLQPGSRNFTYTIEHCDADWNPSQLSPSEYLQSFTDDRMNDYRYSINTIQKYVHYEVSIPNYNIIPKLSGNYILKVYEDGDQNKPVFNRRFYVVDNKVAVRTEITSSNNVGLRAYNQKINFEVNYGKLFVQNPSTDIRALVLQNGRTDKAQMNVNPYNTRATEILYTDLATNDFTGGNEFRHFDLRSLRSNSERVGRIYRDTANTVVLLGDPNRNVASYSFQYDNDGSFFILNQEGHDPRTDADYAHVYFSLAGGRKSQADGAAYLVGKFNDYKLDEHSLMQYDGGRGRFYTDLYIKQGVYDFEYTWVDKNTRIPDDTAFEGSYYETENDYQILVYFRRPGARWEELVGFRQINTSKR
jgi:hypothetical protein